MLRFRLRFACSSESVEGTGVIGDSPSIADTAFIPGGRFDLPGKRGGPLSGLTFAVKDLIDLEGKKTGAGNPDWLAASPVAQVSAPMVQTLLNAGAHCIGKTITDELAFSLEGRNAHYGTPVNPVRPDCLPGGSSSGSAVAVAAGACDFALGTDTGGSVRIPGAFCDLFAIRPSHGVLDMAGVTAFAPSYDTIGWFARDASTLARIGDVLLPARPVPPVQEVFVAEDVFALCNTDHGTALGREAEAFATIESGCLFAADWQDYHQVYARLQARDIRLSLGEALRNIQPIFAPDMAMRFDEALADTAPTTREETLREHFSVALRKALPPGRVAIIPTAPVAALSRNADGETIGDFYPPALAICALAGHAGAPQVQIPTQFGGLSLIGAPGTDRALLRYVASWQINNR